MYYKISDLVVEIDGCSENMKSCLTEYMLPLQQEREHICHSGIFIHKLDEIDVPQGKQFGELGKWKLVEDCEKKKIYRPLNGFEDVASARIDFSENRADISLLSFEEDDIKMRDMIYSGHAFGQLMLNFNRMVVHSSCISVNGKAILFSAPSGTGKSTHTALWKEYVSGTEYINDDTPVIRLDKTDEVLACGSPWSGKTRLNNNISAPLCGIVFLERGTKNQIMPMSGVEAMGRLVGECRKFPYRDSVGQAAKLCMQLLKRVPVYRLACDISYEAVETVRKELLL
ncbi:MAG: hypothetical protein IJD36_04665 [Clostridia bacterium]|nr:hypothetical protein [Clostridia bacterium]